MIYEGIRKILKEQSEARREKKRKVMEIQSNTKKQINSLLGENFLDFFNNRVIGPI